MRVLIINLRINITMSSLNFNYICKNVYKRYNNIIYIYIYIYIHLIITLIYLLISNIRIHNYHTKIYNITLVDNYVKFKLDIKLLYFNIYLDKICILYI